MGPYDVTSLSNIQLLVELKYDGSAAIIDELRSCEPYNVDLIQDTLRQRFDVKKSLTFEDWFAMLRKAEGALTEEEIKILDALTDFDRINRQYIKRFSERKGGPTPEQ